MGGFSAYLSGCNINEGVRPNDLINFAQKDSDDKVVGFGSLYSNMNNTFPRATIQHPIHKLNHKELRKIG